MKNKKGLVILIVIASIAVISVVAGFFVNPGASEPPANSETNSNFVKFEKNFNFLNGKKLPKKIRGNYMAVLHVEGQIGEANRTYNQEWMEGTIKDLQNDSNNLGILLYIDSPGGTVYESDETYLALMKYKKTTRRPIYAYFAGMAASGGYYIGCAADKIFANRNCLTGSIGVIAGSSIDATGLLEKIGVKSRTFTAGKNKAMGSIDRPLTEEQAAIMQSIADDAYEQFTQIVAESRKMPIEKIRELADGRPYTAKQALGNGLIDDICSLEVAKGEIAKDMGLGGIDSFEDFEYVYQEKFFRSFMGMMSFLSNPKASLENVASEANSFNLKYLAY